MLIVSSNCDCHISFGKIGFGQLSRSCAMITVSKPVTGGQCSEHEYTRQKRELQTELLPISNCKYFSVYLLPGRWQCQSKPHYWPWKQFNFDGKMFNCYKYEFNFGICSLKLNTYMKLWTALPSKNESIQFWDCSNSISSIVIILFRMWIRTNSVINWKTLWHCWSIGKKCFEVVRVKCLIEKNRRPIKQHRAQSIECRVPQQKSFCSIILNLLFKCQGLHVTSWSMLNCYYYNFGHPNASKIMEKNADIFVMYSNSFDRVIFFRISGAVWSINKNFTNYNHHQ